MATLKLWILEQKQSRSRVQKNRTRLVNAKVALNKRVTIRIEGTYNELKYSLVMLSQF